MSDLALAPLATTAPAKSRWRIVRAVAAKEWLELFRDRRLVWLCAFIMALMLAALAFGYVENARILRERDAAAQADRELWVGQSAKNPHAAAHFGQYAFKPLSPLALADPGVDAYVGSAVWLEAHKQNETQFKQARDGGVGARLGSLSLAFILQTIAPLIVILMGFASFSGERESGTLKQLLSVGARPRDILAGKAMALIGAIFALLAPAFVGAALALVFLRRSRTPVARRSIDSSRRAWRRLCGLSRGLRFSGAWRFGARQKLTRRAGHAARLLARQFLSRAAPRHGRRARLRADADMARLSRRHRAGQGEDIRP